MKVSRTTMVAVALSIGLCAALTMLVPVSAPLDGMGSFLSHLAGDGMILANPVLIALRADLAGLEQRAAALAAQVTDDTPAEEARRIEAEHEQIIAQIEAKRTAIADAERQQPQEPQKALAPANQPAPGDVADAVNRALAAERARVAEIQSLATAHGLPAEFTSRHINENSTIEAVRAAALEEIRQRGANNPTFPHVQTGGQDEVDTRRRGMTAAITARMARAAGERSVQIPEHARAWGERSIAEMAAECVGWRGPLITPRHLTEMFARAFHVTSDFPAIFTDAMNNRLLARYQAAAPTYRRFASRYVTPDFRETNVIRAGDFPPLQEVNEGGEIKSGTFGESKEAIQTKAWGVKLSISRVMLVNDQLMAIDQVLGSAGVRVADWENAQVFALLVSGSGAGPILKTDNKRVFHTDHGNLASTGTAINVTSIGVGRAAMAKQTTLDGIKANFQPETILVSPDKLTEAEQLVATITPAQQSNAVPESIRRLVPVSDPNLTGNPWYLFASPAVAPVFAYSYLEGFEGPRLTSEDVFDVQGLRVKLEHDFGVAAIDFRGGYRNPGA